MNRASTFESFHTEGGLLSADTLARIAALDAAIPGLRPGDFHLAPGETLGEAASRAWSRMSASWRAFRAGLEGLPAGDPATTLTRERFLLPLFHELGYGRLVAARTREVREGGSDGDGSGGIREYALSHGWGRVPIHLLGARVSLDDRTEKVAGAARMSPHSLVQDFLNRSDDHLWGVVSNGRELRLLRDHRSLTRQSYVGVDLESLFEGERFADFALLYVLCHQSRLEAEQPESTWLEKWFQLSRESGVRALDDLRAGVEKAIEALGRGFLKHPSNETLRRDLAEGTCDKIEYYRELLRLVYRLIFVFAAEDRVVEGKPSLLDPVAPADVVDRYLRFYSTSRLRHLAGQTRGGPHGDLWEQLRLVFGGLHEGCAPLGLPGLGSFLFGRDATRMLDRCELANSDLLAAVNAIAYLERGGVRHVIAWRSVASEELGAIYESFIELFPVLGANGVFELQAAAGNQRKKTGSYYTPASLVETLLDSALEPVLDAAVEGKSRASQEQALLELKVCDPSCGSGNFLVGAARRIARRLAATRTGDEAPSPRHVQAALRDVVGRCLYGVDNNEMAVELCKIALWMEAIEPGKPLSFLDSHIQRGNSLFGATPALLARGIPDEAWTDLTGDDKAVVRLLRKRNREARKSGQMTLFPQLAEAAASLSRAAAPAGCLQTDTLADIRACETRWQEFVNSPDYKQARQLADLWCAAFVWPATEDMAEFAPTQDLWDRAGRNSAAIPAKTKRQVARLSDEYVFFHWHLAFPQVFAVDVERGLDTACGWTGGFNVVLGNVPWEHVELKEIEWFASRSPDIAKAENASKRKTMIKRLEEDDPTLFARYQADLRAVDGAAHFVRRSGRFPLSARGRVNTYALFAELDRFLMGARGRVGCILPSGIATDDTTKELFANLVSSHQLASLFHFENEGLLFPEVHHAFRFCLVTLARDLSANHETDLVFYARQVRDLDVAQRHVTLSASDFAVLNPNTRTCPTFRWRRDADINKAIYRRFPVLWREDAEDGNPWGLRFTQGLFNMASDSALFCSRDQLESESFRLDGNIFARRKERYLPLYEAKMIHHYDHRFATYEGQTDAQANQGKCPELDDAAHADPRWVPLPYYWVAESEVESRLADKWPHSWLLGWRDICRASDVRTVICSLFPRTAVGHTTPLVLGDAFDAEGAACLLAALSSLCLDYLARQKVGGTHLTFAYMKQLPIPTPDELRRPCPWFAGTYAGWLIPRVLELTYTSWDLQPFARPRARRPTLRMERGSTRPASRRARRRVLSPLRRLSRRCRLHPLHLPRAPRAGGEGARRIPFPPPRPRTVRRSRGRFDYPTPCQSRSSFGVGKLISCPGESASSPSEHFPTAHEPVEQRFPC